jgi:alkylation response protein AidB-like acyl-CoA dehydrogenase
MDFSLSDEQVLLVDTASQWASGLRTAGAHRAVLAGKPSPVDAHWAALADNGWLGIMTAEEQGGSGGTLVDACLLVEVLNRELVPLPFASNAVFVPAALQLFGGDSQLLGALASGERRVALGLGSDLTFPGATLAWDWTEGDAVAVVDAAGVTLIERSAVERTNGWDPLRPLGKFSPVREVPVSVLPAAQVRTFMSTVAVVSCAALVGLMDGVLRMALDYARTREQFGQPIGSFQAVQHLCADMYVDLEAARAAALGAAAMVGADDPAAHATAAVAKAWCAEAGVRVSHNAIQVLGGIGNTWESDAHLYLRGCHQWGRAFGGTNAALDEVARRLFDEKKRGDT